MYLIVMEYIFILIFVLGIYHFLWEGILAPSLRSSLRFELFKCRDDLRRLMIEKQNVPKWTFKHMQSLINKAIERMHKLDLLTLYEAEQELKNNPKLKEATEKSVARLDKEISESGCAELAEIRSRVYKNFAVVFAVNSGGWIVYILPVFIGVAMFNNIKAIIKAFLFLPVGAVEKISPSQHIHQSI